MYAERFESEADSLDSAIAEYDGGTKDNNGAITKHGDYAQGIKDSYGKAVTALVKNGFSIDNTVKGYIASFPKERAPQDRSAESR